MEAGKLPFKFSATSSGSTSSKFTIVASFVAIMEKKDQSPKATNGTYSSFLSMPPTRKLFPNPSTPLLTSAPAWLVVLSRNDTYTSLSAVRTYPISSYTWLFVKKLGSTETWPKIGISLTVNGIFALFALSIVWETQELSKPPTGFRVKVTLG